MEGQIRSRPLTGLERHCVGWFPTTLLERRETLEETLGHFEADDRFDLNRHIPTRTHQLYEVTIGSFEPLRQTLIRNPNLVHVEILQEPSDLGIAYKILAKDRAGEVILYDGVMWRVTEPAHEGSFALDQLSELTEWPGYPGDIVDLLQKSLREVIPDFPDGLSFYSFYTVNSTDWEALGLQREGDVNLRLTCRGVRNYSVYIGDRDAALQMIASDLHIEMELKRFLRYFDKQRSSVEKISEATSAELDGMLEPFLRFGRKHKQWSSVKSSLKSLTRIYSKLSKGSLLIDSISKVIDDRLAFFYHGRTQRPCPGFYRAELEDGQLSSLSKRPEEPVYIDTFEDLKKKVEVLRREIILVLSTEKDLLTAFQTEFSLYAVWLAVIALLISIAVAVLQICWSAG